MSFVYNYLIEAMWLGWAIYWRFASLNVKKTTRLEPLGSRLTHMAPLIAGVFLLLWPVRTGVLFERTWPGSYFTFWTGTVLVAYGLGFAIWARRVLGRNWSGLVTLKEDHQLIQEGPYRWVRHPIYTGLLLAFLGSAIAIGEWRGILAFVLAFAAFDIKRRIEERWMKEVFGTSYEQYQKRVRALIPLVW